MYIYIYSNAITKYHRYIIHYVYPFLPLCTIALVVRFRKQLYNTLPSVTPVSSGDPGLWSRHRIRCFTQYLQKLSEMLIAVFFLFVMIVFSLP